MEKKTMTVLQEVKEKMTELQAKKEADLAEIREKKAAAEAEFNEAERALNEATEMMDLEAYDKATKDKQRAALAIGMYAGRYNQIRQQEYISEEESDKVLANLDAYEEELASHFVDALAGPLSELEQILDEYLGGVEEVEQTILAWTRDIHANYRSNCTTFADGTNRSSVPLPYRRVPFHGCPESTWLADYLKKGREAR